jgi:hypothetical protein
VVDASRFERLEALSGYLEWDDIPDFWFFNRKVANPIDPKPARRRVVPTDFTRLDDSQKA